MATIKEKIAKELDNGAFIEEKLRLTREQVLAAGSYTRQEASSLVGFYYDVQQVRVAQSNRVSAQTREVTALANPALLETLKDGLKGIENQTARALKAWVLSQKLGQWAMGIAGIGPVLAAGLLSHIDLTACGCRQYDGVPRNKRPEHECPGITTAGAVWKFAGLLPPDQQRWEKGQRRPYDARLKTICWKVGEGFKKIPIEKAMSGSDETLYCRLYRQRKAKEIEQNNRGAFRHLAEAKLADAKRMKWRISPEQREVWESGKIQDKGLDLRSMRYAVKIFLSHLHQIGREILFGEQVRPWIIVHGGHTDYIPPPCWPMKK